MGLGKKLERRFHELRTHALDWCRSYYGFRRLTLYMIGRETTRLTHQFADHVMAFSPHEYIGKHLYLSGHFQRDHADAVLSVLDDLPGPRPRTLLEIGANIGTHSVYLTRRGHFDRMICIEPLPGNLDLLRENLRLNGLTGMATVVDCAVGDNEGHVDLHVDDTNHGAGSLMKTARSARSIRVPLRRVDNILGELGIAPGDIGLVWMDIEGAEPDALKSMEGITAIRVPILMEFSPALYGSEGTSALIDYLAARYETCIVFAGAPRRMPVREIPHRSADILLLP